MQFGLPELAIILVIVVLLFGIGRIGRIGSELGGGIRSFREGLKGKEDSPEGQTEVSESEKKSAKK